jgi:hypothetical protein
MSLACRDQQGFLLKRSEYLHKWNNRWFALDSIYTYTLYYYDSEAKNQLLGSYSITAEATIENDDSDYQFLLTTDGKTLMVNAPSNNERMEWITSIKYVIDMQQLREKSASDGLATEKQRSKPLLSRALNAACVVPNAFSVGHWGKPNTINTALDLANESLNCPVGNNADEKKMIDLYSICRRLGVERSGAKYKPFGHYMALEGLIHKAVTRLKMLDYLKRHPTIESTSLGPSEPIFIIGLNGSGESALHSVLSAHPDLCVHNTWEQLDPVPSTDDEARDIQAQDRTARYQKNKKLFQRAVVASGMGEDMNSLHEIDYDGAEECTIPCAMELPWSILEIPFNAYAAKELMTLGAGNAFVLYKKYLQLLTWQSSRRFERGLTWLLHCPHHLPYIEDLHRVFPNATYVWMHRNPKDCILTMCSLYDVILQMVMLPASINRHALGRAVLEYCKEALARANRSIRRLQSELRIVHVCLPDGDRMTDINVQHMRGVCKTILSHAGVSYSDSFDKSLSEYFISALECDSTTTKNLAKYGLSPEIIDPFFSEYMEDYVDTASNYLVTVPDRESIYVDRHSDLSATTANMNRDSSFGKSDGDVMFYVLVALVAFNGVITVVSTLSSAIPAGMLTHSPYENHPSYSAQCLLM